VEAVRQEAAVEREEEVVMEAMVEQEVAAETGWVAMEEVVWAAAARGAATVEAAAVEAARAAESMAVAMAAAEGAGLEATAAKRASVSEREVALLEVTR
jgi:hypothetical protein